MVSQARNVWRAPTRLLADFPNSPRHAEVLRAQRHQRAVLMHGRGASKHAPNRISKDCLANEASKQIVITLSSWRRCMRVGRGPGGDACSQDSAKVSGRMKLPKVSKRLRRGISPDKISDGPRNIKFFNFADFDSISSITTFEILREKPE